jgi:hypothetical protein
MILDKIDSFNMNMTEADLIILYGRCIEPKELAKFLHLDIRTLKKYSDRWGGVEVSPGRYRFFENQVKEVLNAKFNQKKGRPALSRKCNNKGNNTAKTISRQHKEIRKGGIIMGTRNAKETKTGTRKSRHGLFDGD